MIGWLLLGVVAGFALGLGAGWWLFGRSAVDAAGAAEAGAPSLAPERSLAEPLVTGDRTDEEIHQALDATKGLLDELEGRYRGRTAPPEEGEKPRRRAPRRPPK